MNNKQNIISEYHIILPSKTSQLTNYSKLTISQDRNCSQIIHNNLSKRLSEISSPLTRGSVEKDSLGSEEVAALMDNYFSTPTISFGEESPAIQPKTTPGHFENFLNSLSPVTPPTKSVLFSSIAVPKSSVGHPSMHKRFKTPSSVIKFGEAKYGFRDDQNTQEELRTISIGKHKQLF